MLSVWGVLEALSLVECLTAWEEAELLPVRDIVLPELEQGGLLPSWEIALLALPSLEGVLLGGTTLASWEAVLSWGRGLPACLGRNCLRPIIA